LRTCVVVEVAAEEAFQRLAELVEEAGNRGGPVDWWGVRSEMPLPRAGRARTTALVAADALTLVESVDGEPHRSR
jgi:hypothetical protein